HLTANARKSAHQRGKSDPIGALNVARVALQEGLQSFPAAHLDGPELDLRLLVDHRERLVRHRVALNSTLLWHLHDLWPELRPPPRRRQEHPRSDPLPQALPRPPRLAPVAADRPHPGSGHKHINLLT